MPTYTYMCKIGHRFEQFLPLCLFEMEIRCDCGMVAERIITAPLLVAAQPECRYDSPVDGRPITTWAERHNDLARHNCIPYDPEIKNDQLRREKLRDESLDKAIDRTVEASISKMNGQQRAQLNVELNRKGATLETVRSTKET